MPRSPYEVSPADVPEFIVPELPPLLKKAVLEATEPGATPRQEAHALWHIFWALPEGTVITMEPAVLIPRILEKDHGLRSKKARHFSEREREKVENSLFKQGE